MELTDEGEQDTDVPPLVGGVELVAGVDEVVAADDRRAGHATDGGANTVEPGGSLVAFAHGDEGCTGEVAAVELVDLRYQWISGGRRRQGRRKLTMSASNAQKMGLRYLSQELHPRMSRVGIANPV